MSGSLNDIKRKIKSITGIRKITRAMELVSSTKLKSAERRLKKLKPYSDTLIDAIGKITSGTSSLYTKGNGVNSAAVILLASDKGLAGGYNVNLCKYAAEYMRSLESPKIIAVGAKGRSYFESEGYDVMQSYTGVSEMPAYEDAARVGKFVTELYKNGHVGQIHLIYTKFRSSIVYEPTAVKLLPADLSGGESTVMNYEPAGEDMLNYLIPRYVSGSIFGAMTEAAASESGARRLAMQNATDNASDILDELYLQKNRARQAVITQEISEIVGGSQAVES